MNTLRVWLACGVAAGLAMPGIAAAQETRRDIEPRTAADSSLPPYSGAVPAVFVQVFCSDVQGSAVKR